MNESLGGMRSPRATPRALALGVAVYLVIAGASPPTTGRTDLSTDVGSEVWLRGETNLTSWQCHGEELAGGLSLAAAREDLEELLDRHQASASPPPLPNLRPSMRLEIPIASLDCGHRAMERDMRSTLRAEEFPLIAFELRSAQEAQLFPGSPGEPVRYRLRVRGDLELAGTRRPVELTVTGLREGADRFRLYTSLPLAMSDFGLEPPVALFGLLRARDDLTVAVTLVLSAMPDG